MFRTIKVQLFRKLYELARVVGWVGWVEWVGQPCGLYTSVDTSRRKCKQGRIIVLLSVWHGVEQQIKEPTTN